MPLVVEVLCGRHFFVESPRVYTKFAYGGKEFSTKADEQTSPKWPEKFEVPYDNKPVEISFKVMNQGALTSTQIASVTVCWPGSFLPGLRRVEDYVVKPEGAGVKDTAAIRVAATLVPDGEPREKKGNRKALMVGMSYPGTDNELPFCHTDAEIMANLFTKKWGFSTSPENFKILLDCKPKFPEYKGAPKPTGENIRAGMRWLVDGAAPGDSLLFFYSGHGTHELDPSRREKDGFNEALVPCDSDKNGVIIDDEIHKLMVAPLPEGVRLTCILDACHSGSGFDLPFRWSPYLGAGDWQLDLGGVYSKADVISISACDDNQVAVGVQNLTGAEIPQGVCSSALHVALEVHETQCKMNWQEMFNIMKTVLDDFERKQKVQLSSSQKFDLSREFDFHGCIPNSNQIQGVVSRGGDIFSMGEPLTAPRTSPAQMKSMPKPLMESAAPEIEMEEKPAAACCCFP